MKDSTFSYILGALSYLLFVLILFAKGLVFIYTIPMFLIGAIFPQSDNVGFGGLPGFLLIVFLSILVYPFMFILAAKIFRKKISVGKVFIGFLITAVIVNIIKIATDIFLQP